MPTILQISKVVLVVAITLSGNVFAQNRPRFDLSFKSDSIGVLNVVVSSAKVVASLKSPASASFLTVDPATSKALLSAEEIVQLNRQSYSEEGGGILFLVARYPSQRTKPTGYCGAGFEDYLLLVGFDQARFNLKDKMLVQSCLQSLDFASDKGDDPMHALTLEQSKPVIHVQWLSHPKYGNKEMTISVDGNRLIVQ